MIDKIKLILANLDKTILGKQELLARLEVAGDEVSSITAAFLKLNVDELVRIRDDIKLLEAEHDAIINPDLGGVEVFFPIEKDPRQMDLPL